MNTFQPISKIELYYKKSSRCLKELGIRETFRRIRRELSRKRENKLDISWVTDQLAVGAAPYRPCTLKMLADFEISDLIDLRAERNEADLLTDPRVFKVHWVPTYDDWGPKDFLFFDQLILTFNKIACNPVYKALICCGAGEHRAPLGGAVALLTLGHSLGEAIELIKKARPVAEFLPVYVRSLEEYLKCKNPANGARRTARGF